MNSHPVNRLCPHSKSVKDSTQPRLRRHGIVAVGLLTAAAQASAKAVESAAGPVTGMEMLRLFLGLGTVLGLLLLGAWLLKRLSKTGFRRQGGQLRIVSSLSVGNRARILLVDVEGARLLLGSGPQRVELIARLENGTESMEPPGGNENSFVTRLAQHLGSAKQGEKH